MWPVSKGIKGKQIDAYGNKWFLEKVLFRLAY